MVDASFTLSDPGTLKATTRGRAVAAFALAVSALIIGFGVTASPIARLVQLTVIGVFAIAVFLSTREHLTVTPEHLTYRKASLLGAAGVSASRSSILGVRLAAGAGYESVPNFVVSIILEGSGLPSGFPLFESIDLPRAEGVANQVAAHLAVPLLGVPSRGASAV